MQGKNEERCKQAHVSVENKTERYLRFCRMRIFAGTMRKKRKNTKTEREEARGKTKSDYNRDKERQRTRFNGNEERELFADLQTENVCAR